MPSTRSASRKQVGQNGSPSEEQEVLIYTQAIEEHIQQVQAGIQQLAREMEALRKKNESLQSELEAAQETSVVRGPRRRSTSGSEDDTDLAEIQIRKLKDVVKELKGENHKQKRRIEKLKIMQLQEEVKDLQTGPDDKDPAGEEDELDPEFRMRKLLRSFSDLMTVLTIPDDDSERCPICFDTLQLKKSSGCQHLVCNTCLPQISKGADETVLCPTCRAVSSRDEIQLVHMTEQGRWDQLLMVAQAWAAFDHRGAQETSEEEDEDNFMTDGDGTSEAHSETNKTDEGTLSEAAPVTTDEEEALLEPSTPPPVSGRPFSQSPMKEKRKRLEQLAEERARAQKRRK
ncbi:hypothetical protein BDZ97DRAFT_1915393 [Flammula alnicola]|nr:hypothetical protein BDZ97DRAFT_1915393 [Flammula alnicola]